MNNSVSLRSSSSSSRSVSLKDGVPTATRKLMNANVKHSGRALMKASRKSKLHGEKVKEENVADQKPTIIVSRSEPDDICARLTVLGLNAVRGEPGTDYVWFPHGLKFGIERKTVTNLLGSLKDRQLVEQAHRGVKDFDRYFILIEGEYRQNATGGFEFYSPRHPEAKNGWVTSGWRYDAIDGMLLDLSLLGCIVVHCASFQHDRKIAAIVSNTSADNHKFIRERQRPDLPPSALLGGELYSDALWALMALPGCGPEVAQALIGQYGSLASVVDNLTFVGEHAAPGVIRPEFVAVNGKKLGKKRADRLREAVTQTF